MKWLIVPLESFSPHGLKGQKHVTLEDLPWIVRKFLSVFPKPFIIADESSKIKVNTPMAEDKKSARTRLVKLLNQFGERCIMTGTLKSKSPVNVIDQFEFLKEGYFPESMWEFAERYCVMETVFVGKARRRVLIRESTYLWIRNYLKRCYIQNGESALRAAKQVVMDRHVVSYACQEHIIRHKKYTPFLRQAELLRRIAPVSLVARREDVFDITFDKFVIEPIMRPVELSAKGKALAKELVDLGFTDNFVLGKAPALELLHRIQDVCNGFEPLKDENGVVTHRALPESPKVDELLSLLSEIGVENNQVAVWCSRTLLLHSCAEAFEKEGYSYVKYNGEATPDEKAEAERKFKDKEAQIFLANPASAAYGLNCLAQCSYSVFICIDDSVEKYHQAQHRILRGQLFAPKFSYHIYTKGTVEERQQSRLRAGLELVTDSNTKNMFELF
jgi:SNF2 family DNA or RNA helicase